MILTETEKDMLAAVHHELREHDIHLIETNKKESRELVRYLMCWIREEIQRTPTRGDPIA